MLQQINAAHDQLRVFYELSRQRMLDKKRISEDDALKFARIDERLFQLQKDPLQREFYEAKKQFHPDYVRKHFALGREEDE